MHLVNRVALIALPAALVACSGSTAPHAVPSSPPSTTPSASSASALPVASAYILRPQKGVSYDAMKAAFDKISKIPGLRGVDLVRARGLRVDLAVPDSPRQREQVLAILTALGKVDVAY